MSVLARVLCTAFIAVASAPTWAERPAPAELSATALQGHLHQVPPERIQEAVEREAREVRDAAALSPDKVGGATAIFKHGMTPAALEEIASGAALEIGSVELKVPAGEEGLVFTIWIGEDLLLLLDGSVRERLSKAIGRQRYRFLTLADSAEGSDAELFEEVAHSQEMHVYKARFVGPTAEMASLLDREAVRAVTLDDTPNRANAYLALKETYANTKHGSVLRTIAPDPETLRSIGRDVPQGMQNNPVVIQR